MDDQILYHGECSNDKVKESAFLTSDFYLQTSTSEGLSRSFIESLLYQLIPIVTPVGDTLSYLTQNTAIILQDDISHTSFDKLKYFLNNHKYITSTNLKVILKKNSEIRIKKAFKDVLSDG